MPAPRAGFEALLKVAMEVDGDAGKSMVMRISEVSVARRKCQEEAPEWVSSYGVNTKSRESQIGIRASKLAGDPKLSKSILISREHEKRCL